MEIGDWRLCAVFGNARLLLPQRLTFPLYFFPHLFFNFHFSYISYEAEGDLDHWMVELKSGGRPKTNYYLLYLVQIKQMKSSSGSAVLGGVGLISKIF